MITSKQINWFKATIAIIFFAIIFLTLVIPFLAKAEKECDSCKVPYHNYAYPTNSLITISPSGLAKAMYYEAKLQNPNLEFSLKFDPNKYPRLLFYLSGDGDNAKLYYTRFFSTELVDWILAQPDNSIAPHSLFARAIRLAKGDVLEAIICIHETLRTYARGTAPYTVGGIDLNTRDNLYIDILLGLKSEDS